MAGKQVKTNQRPGVRTAMLSITMTPEVKQRLAALAQKWERSLSWTAEKILRDYLKSPR
jgi:predicted transcriptional regulator